jgi:hypothetical protein
LRITGTLDHPAEDLTERLQSAAGQRMFEIIPETGEKVLKFTRSMLGESPTKTIDDGVKLIEDGTKTMRGVANGLIDGILGGGNPPPQPPRELPEESPKVPARKPDGP